MRGLRQNLVVQSHIGHCSPQLVFTVSNCLSRHAGTPLDLRIPLPAAERLLRYRILRLVYAIVAPSTIATSTYRTLLIDCSAVCFCLAVGTSTYAPVSDSPSGSVLGRQVNRAQVARMRSRSTLTSTSSPPHRFSPCVYGASRLL